MNEKWKGPFRRNVKNSSDNTDDSAADGKGVYVMCRERDTIQTAYVGESGQSVSERIDEHCKKSEENEKLREFIHDSEYTFRYYYLKVDDKEERKNYEHTLYRRFGGRDGKLCNEAEPSGNYIKNVDLPY